jgi:MFS family permease
VALYWNEAVMSNSRTFARAAVAVAPGQTKGVAFAALRHPGYGTYWLVSLLSQLADNIEHVISYWVIFQVFQSPVLGGFAVISHWTPSLLFSVYLGAVADKFDCRRIIQASTGMLMLSSFLWGVLFLTGTLQIWHTVILLILHGLAGALGGPASQLIIHDIVGRENLQSAVRLNSTGRQIGLLLGPGVGGALLVAFGPAWGLIVNVLLFLPIMAWLTLTPYSGHGRDSGRAGNAIGLADALHTLRELSGNPAIITMVALAGFGSILVGNAFQVQMPAFARDLGTDKTGIAYSVLLAANAAGAVVGGVVLEGMGFLKPHVRTAIISASLWCLSITVFAFAPNYPIAVLMLFLAGLFNLTSNSMAQTLVQLLAPPEKRGRAVGLFNMAALGLRVGSGVTVGVLGGIIGIHWSLGLSALTLLAITLGLLGLISTGRRRYAQMAA